MRWAEKAPDSQSPAACRPGRVNTAVFPASAPGPGETGSQQVKGLNTFLSVHYYCHGPLGQGAMLFNQRPDSYPTWARQREVPCWTSHRKQLQEGKDTEGVSKGILERGNSYS